MHFFAGSPAHAGIDPDGDVPTADGSGFPRTRGDRPLVNSLTFAR